MKKEMLVTLSMVIMALVVCLSLSPSIVRADSSDNQSKYPVYTYTKDGETISTWVYEGEDKEVDGDYYTEGQFHIKGPKGTFYLASDNPISYGFDCYGTMWIVDGDNNSIFGWNYYLQYDEYMVYLCNVKRDEKWVYDAASVIFDENNEYVVGYKTLSGDIYPVLSYEEIVEKTANNRKKDPSPTPTAPSVPTPTPSNPSKPVTPVKPGVTTPVPTVPVVTPDVTTNPTTSPNAPQKLSIKKKKSKISLYVGSKLMSSYRLKKGTLTWNIGKKTGKVKNVKAVGYIKKSKNLIYITKNGKAYTISSKGKKKVILKKGARKLVLKGGFVTKVNKKAGSLNVTGK